MNLKNLVTVMIMMLFATTTFAQAKKLDKIIKKDYEVIECTITKETDEFVEYTLPKETMTVSLSISKIARIELASGKVQTFNNVEQQALTPASTSNATMSGVVLKTNTLAVLPVPYVNSENLNNSEEMAKFAQNDIYTKLLDKSSNIYPLTVQDLRDTNNLLRKAGLDYKNIDEVSIDELQKILGVDNIIAAKVSYTVVQNQTTGTYDSGNVKLNDNNKKATTQNYSVANTQNQMVYSYHVYFDMYKNGSKIYTESRVPVFKLKDSWMDSVSYLLKRSPIYSKK